MNHHDISLSRALHCDLGALIGDIYICIFIVYLLNNISHIVYTIIIRGSLNIAWGVAMAIIPVGSGSYTTTLPEGVVTPSSYNGVPLDPKVADGFVGAVPTNDWSTSIVFPRFSDQYSSPMFAGPVNVKADASGFNLGYTTSPNIIYYNDDPQKQFVFQYTYHSDLNVGLVGMNANSTQLESTSAYFNKALWQDSDSSNQLHATFGHGSPFVYFERTGNADALIDLKSESSGNSIGQPDSTTNEVFKIEHVNGSYNGGQLGMHLLVNAVAGQGSAVGNSVEARVSIDTNGDGKFDYVQTINYLALDPVVNQYEDYFQSESGRSSGANVIGELKNLNDATVKIEVWKPFGSGDVSVQTGTSNIALPFDNLSVSGSAINNTLFLSGDNVAHALLATQPAVSAATLGASGGSVVPWDGQGEVWYDDHNVIGVTINDNNYGLFAPTGSEWHLDHGVITSDLNGKDYFSAALLPDNSVATLQYFYDHAYTFVTDSHVNFSYDAENAKVNTILSVDTESKEPGHATETLTALYPHQWLNTDDILSNYTYESPRGEMKLLDGNSFSTDIAYTGLLPELPSFLDDTQKTQLYNLIDTEYHQLQSMSDPIGPTDSYWSAKLTARMGELAELSDQVGHQAAKQYFVDTIKAELQDWFTADPSDPKDQQFYYNAQWDLLQPYPGAYGSDDQLNDHHFHAGYFIRDAYEVAKFDPQWVNDWGDMMNLFIKSVANTDTMDTMFPFLRNFDPYEGHSWASGDGSFFSGNNQESSSEALNFASSLALWGGITHNTQLENLGSYLFSTELAAVQQYWFDINNMNFPDTFNHTTAGIVWSDGATYSTWFSADPEKIQGINYLPVTATSLYLGLYPDYVAKNFSEISQWNNGPANDWTDLVREYQALYDPAAALNGYNFNYTPEEGESYAHTYNWLHNLSELGQVDRFITADSLFYGVFNKDGLITYVAYNPADTQQVVTFSDGKVLTLDAHETLAVNADREWSSVTGTVIHVDPSPVPPSPDPAPPSPDPAPPTPPVPDTLPSNNSTGIRIEGRNIYGTNNNDVIVAPDAQGYNIYGANGNDSMMGGDGGDRIYGTNGNNIIIGGKGADFMNGGQGQNVYKYISISDSTTSQMDTIEQFKHGTDKLDLSALDIASNDVHLAAVNDLATLTVNGSDFSTKFIAMNGAITLDDMIFKAGVTPQPVPPGPDPVPPQPDPVPPPVPDNPPSNSDAGVRVEGHNIYGTNNNDIIVAPDAQGYTIYGAYGNDSMMGGDGNDRIYGTNGNNTLIGGGGADFMNGGEGHNVYKYLSINDSTASQIDTIEQFKHGTDKLDLSSLDIARSDVHLAVVSDLATLTVSGSDFATKFIAMMGLVTLDDIIFKNGVTPQPAPQPVPDPVPPTPPVPDDLSTNNSAGVRVEGHNIYGTNNNDIIVAPDGQGYNIYGANGNDSMMGGDGNDRIYGTNGNNTLIGGEGADFMNGGEGHNVYKYLSISDSTTSEMDTIEQFKHGTDKLDLSTLDIARSDVHLAVVSDLATLTVSGSDFATKFIAMNGIVTLDDMIFKEGVTPHAVPIDPNPVSAVPPVPGDLSTNNSAGVRVEGHNIYGTNNNDVIVATDAQGYNIYGAYGDDSMMGGDGNDRIYGINGNNTIIGGKGADFMNGGEGHNVYKYLGLADSTTLQPDTIERFKHGQDTLDLSLVHVNRDDIHIVSVNDSSKLTIDHTNFEIDLIASQPITHGDILV